MEVEKAYTIGVLECSKDIILIVKRNGLANAIVVNDDRKGWPAIQIFPDRSPICATKLETETEW